MSCSFRFSPLSSVVAALAPTWAMWCMTDEAPAVAAADADTAEKAQDASDEAPATVSIDVPAQHQSLLAQADSWIVDNIEAGISHFENLFKSEAEAAKAGDQDGGKTEESKDA